VHSLENIFRLEIFLRFLLYVRFESERYEYVVKVS
jgi:hypothetical protein